jgi:hypothetical protein
MSRVRGGLSPATACTSELNEADRNTLSVETKTLYCSHPGAAILYHFGTYCIFFVTVQHQLDRLTLIATTAQKEIPFLRAPKKYTKYATRKRGYGIYELWQMK